MVTRQALLSEMTLNGGIVPLLIEKFGEPWSWTYDFVEYKQFLLLYDGDTTGVVIEMTALRSADCSQTTKSFEI
jgi:hypothetical protein